MSQCIARLSGRGRQRPSTSRGRGAAFGLALVLGTMTSTIATADEDGISFWLPGLFGSLAAAPQQPGFSFTSVYFHDRLHAAGNVSRARATTIGNIPVNVSVGASGTVDATLNLALMIPSYVFKDPVLGGQLFVSVLTLYGRNGVSLGANFSGTVSTPLGTLPFSRSASISDAVTGFGDLYPMTGLRWNAGVNNYMVYVTGDIPVGAYEPARLGNIGIGHGAVDGGAGYTYFNPKTGHEFSGVLGFTHNTMNPSTQYKSGTDMHLDWGASQFLTQQLQIGMVGYVYNQLGCDSGAGDRVGCFQTQVVGLGPQIGYIVPLGHIQAYINLKGYGEFAAQNRPHGWNTWLTVQLAPAPPTPEAPSAPMRRVPMK